MPYWEVVAGDRQGSLLVRRGQDFASGHLDERLLVGAVVEEVQLADDRLSYRLLAGEGPREGWVSVRVGTKELLSPRPDSDRLDKLKARLAGFCERSPGRICAPLPAEAAEWEGRECDLWLQTEGMFHPRTHRGNVDKNLFNKGRVSVIVPTVESRQAYHEFLWLGFESQDWPNKELIVVETYAGLPSPFFSEKSKEDSRIVYLAFQLPAESDFTIGLKRNICVQMSTGQYIAHFDDDDLYAPNYLSVMTSALQEQAATQAVTLASWYLEEAETGEFSYCNPIRVGWRRHMDNTEEWVHHYLYGFGFSFVYRRSAALRLGFPNRSKGEDYEFYSRVLRKGEDQVFTFEDRLGICLHVQHGTCVGDCRPCRNRKVPPAEVDGLHFAFAPGFGMCLELANLSTQLAFFEQNPDLGFGMLTAMAAGLSQEQLAVLAAGLSEEEQAVLAARLSEEQVLTPEFAAVLAARLDEQHLASMAAGLSSKQREFLVAGISGQQPLFSEVAHLVANLGEGQLGALGAAVTGDSGDPGDPAQPVIDVL